MIDPILRSIQVGLPASYGEDEAEDPMDSAWVTGFYKGPVEGPVLLGRTNLEGDGQADLENHGGPDKAVCVYSADHYPAWRAELTLPEMPFGAFGENFTVEGLAEADVCIGDVWKVGRATVQVSQPRQPCWKLARRWRLNDLAARVVRNGRTGWYFRVLEGGPVEAGRPLERLERPFPAWTVERANRVMHHDKKDVASMGELAGLPPLSGSWRETLENRLRRASKAD